MTMLDTTAAPLAANAPALSPARWRHRYQNLLCHKCDSHNIDYGTSSMAYKEKFVT